MKFKITITMAAIIVVTATTLAHDGGHGGMLGDPPVPAENPITEEKRILGKILFWDEQLSSNNTVSCGTCHIPSSGGADPRLGLHPGADGMFETSDDVIGSPGIARLDINQNPVNDPDFGFEPQVTGRAAQAYFMGMYGEDNFWDGRATSEFVDPEDGTTVLIPSGAGLESQAVGPILSSVEMAHQGRDWSDVRAKLQSVTPLLYASDIPTDMQDAVNANPTYPDLFDAAFGSTNISAFRIAKAIATYERTLVPNESPWDLYMSGDLDALSEAQESGWNFLNTDQNCLHCHTPPEFTDNLFHNIGLRPSSEDFGRENVSGDHDDRGAFKTPSLRNIGLRATLGSNGQLIDVTDTIEFYLEENNHVQFTQDQSQIPVGNGESLSYSVLSVPVEGPTGVPIRANVIDFLVNGLTDPRVAAETFPFDRPTLFSELNPLINLFYDCNYTGMENGTLSRPYNSIAEALLHTSDSANIYILTGTHGETMTIDEPRTLRTWNGTAIIGQIP